LATWKRRNKLSNFCQTRPSTSSKLSEATGLCALFSLRDGFGLIVASTGSEALAMLMTIFVILLVLWLLGMVTSYTLYGYIHILLVIAIVVFLIRVIQGRNPL
jgi:predicted ferric reductase